jgi:hypothetical protein
MERKLRRRIYVAGAIRNPNCMELLGNLRKGMRVCTEFILEGYAPFCPFIDFLLIFQLQPGEVITEDDILDYSVSFISDSEIMYVVPGYEESTGVKDEVEKAHSLNIPIFYDKECALEYLRVGPNVCWDTFK